MKKEGRENRAHDVLNYACINWITHVQRLEENEISDSRLTALLKYFLGSMDQSSLACQNWHEMVGYYFHESIACPKIYSALPLYRVYWQLSPCSWASLAIVMFGYHKTIPDCWTLGFAGIDQKTSSGNTLLLLGAKRGPIPIVDDLLKKGADINASGGSYGSALEVASDSGHESVVQLLLGKGADPNASNGWYGGALPAASCSGHESVVQLLLDKGADINASGEVGPAHGIASSFCHESIVLLLLNKGADVNGPGGHYGSTLQAASLLGHESVVRLLLNNGADVNASGGAHWRALHAALVVNQISSLNFSRRSIVQSLLNKGADVNAPIDDI